MIVKQIQSHLHCLIISLHLLTQMRLQLIRNHIAERVAVGKISRIILIPSYGT